VSTRTRVVVVDDHQMFRSGVLAELGERVATAAILFRDRLLRPGFVLPVVRLAPVAPYGGCMALSGNSGSLGHVEGLGHGVWLYLHRKYYAAEDFDETVDETVLHELLHNELTQFRYDVTLRTGPAVAASPPAAVLDWERDGLTIEKLRHDLLASGPDSLWIMRVPNARTASAADLVRRLEDSEDALTAGDLRHAADRAPFAAIDPEDLWAMTDDVPYIVEVSWAQGYPDGAYDVVFRRAGTSDGAAGLPSQLAVPSTRGAYTNRPHHASSDQQLIPQVRTFLQARLPDYMLPASYVVLDELPLTPNGKVDLSALPAPDTDRPPLGHSYVAPRTALERVLAAQFASVLGLARVGVTDRFFELGGHSLLATQLVARIVDTLGVPLTLRTVFSKPTVADLAAALIAEAGAGGRLERVAALVSAVAEMPEDEAAELLAPRARSGAVRPPRFGA